MACIILAEAYPLRLELLTTCSDGDVVLKYAIVVPERKLLQRWATSKKLNGALVRVVDSVGKK